MSRISHLTVLQSSTVGKGYVLNLFWLGCSQLLKHAAFVSCVFVLSCVQCIAPLEGGGQHLMDWPNNVLPAVAPLREKINHVEEIER